jgi:hypothetical protein
LHNQSQLQDADADVVASDRTAAAIDLIFISQVLLMTHPVCARVVDAPMRGGFPNVTVCHSADNEKGPVARPSRGCASLLLLLVLLLAILGLALLGLALGAVGARGGVDEGRGRRGRLTRALLLLLRLLGGLLSGLLSALLGALRLLLRALSLLLRGLLGGLLRLLLLLGGALLL